MKKYIVRDGDTMWKISKETGIRLNLLMAANPQVSDPNQLRPGSVLVVPELNKPAGQSYPQTAQPHQQAEPAAAAPMQSPGSMPAQVVPPYFGFVWPHIVQQGETWESIAKRYHVELSALRQMNASYQERSVKEGDMVYVPAMTSKSAKPPKSSQQGAKLGSSMEQGMPYAMPTTAPSMPQGYPAGQPGIPPMDPGQGPHTHYPYRAEQPLPPIYWQPSPMPQIQYMPSPYTLHPMVAHPHMTSVWYDEWDESSSWESSWESGSSSTIRQNYRSSNDGRRFKDTDDDDSYPQ
jgi:LysM repeat protein